MTIPDNAMTSAIEDGWERLPAHLLRGMLDIFSGKSETWRHLTIEIGNFPGLFRDELARLNILIPLAEAREKGGRSESLAAELAEREAMYALPDLDDGIVTKTTENGNQITMRNGTIVAITIQAPYKESGI